MTLPEIYICIVSGVCQKKNYKQQFDNIYPELAKERQLIFMPFFLQDVALQEEYLLNDYMHPNNKGIIIIADNLFPYIKKAIKF